MTLEERLNQIIEEKDSQIESLNDKVFEMQEMQNAINNKWMHHFEFEPNPAFSKLPLPRLEMRVIRESKSRLNFHYGLVYKPVFLLEETLAFIPIGYTTRSGGNYTFGETPYRDGVHIKKDTLHLNIPAFLVDYETGQCMNIEDAR